jgi:ferritin
MLPVGNKPKHKETTMLSNKILSQLHEQIKLEFFSSNLYLQMSSWCAWKGYVGAAAFLRANAEDERQHMIKLFDYVNDTGAMVTLGAIPAPPSDFTCLGGIFKAVYEHELLITRAINELAGAALDERDFSTFNFLQWYVTEQHEEEKLFKSIVDRIELIGLDGRGIFWMDKELGKLVKS